MKKYASITMLLIGNTLFTQSLHLLKRLALLFFSAYVALFSSLSNAQQFQETPDIVITPNFCSLYPITIPSELLVGGVTDQAFSNIPLGTGPGNYSWLTWQGQTDANTVSTSLVPPGDSQNYINPKNNLDLQLDAGNWVQGAPGVKNSSLIRENLDRLIGRNIIIPVWKSNELQGANFNYEIEKFAVISLRGYSLSGNGYIDFIFKRFTRCYNARPVANDQTVTSDEDTPVDFTLDASDTDGNALEYEITTQPQHGKIIADGASVSYTPTANYFGSDTLTFSVNDGEQSSNTATVTFDINPVDDAPTADNKSAELPEDTSILLPFSGSDIENDTLTFTPVNNPAHGMLTQSQDGYTYTPEANYFGNDSFEYVANDGQLDSEAATYTINITPVNDPPVTSGFSTETKSGEPVTVKLSASDIDSTTITFTLLTQPNNGTVSISGNELTYISDSAFTGNISFLFAAFDGVDLSTPVEGNIVVIPNNEPPEIISQPVTTAIEGSQYQYDVDAIDPNPNDILNYSIATAPEGMTIDSATGLLSWAAPEKYLDNRTDQNSACYGLPQGTMSDAPPRVKWSWDGSNSTEYGNYNQVLMTPLVVQLTDDNGDGKIDSADQPDVVILGHDTGGQGGIVRALNGADGSELWVFKDKTFYWSSNLAAADLDNDGTVEIVGLTVYKTLAAISHDGKLKWVSSSQALPTGLAGGPTIADIDMDGTPEIIYANKVFSNNGVLLWAGKGNFIGANDSFSGIDFPFDSVGDISEHPGQEIVVGASMYGADGTLLWEDTELGDGYTAIANVDKDSAPEIIFVGHGNVYILKNDGTILRGPVSLPGGGNGGAISVADFNGDGKTEIGIAGGSQYIVFNDKLEVLWTQNTKDEASGITGSSVFDFNGDGKPEIIYGDEQHLRIYDGTSGSPIYEIVNNSTTGSEIPVVADLDNDGHAEIIAAANTYAGGTLHGIRVFEDANDQWAPARPLWNQYYYYIDNINNDFTVPVEPTKSWLTHNTIRSNSLVNGGPTALPDLTVHSISMDLSTSSLSALVTNRGLAPITTPFSVTFSNVIGSNATELGTQQIQSLEPGEQIKVTITLNSTQLTGDLRAEIVFETPVYECITSNNSTMASIVEAKVADPAGLTDTQTFTVAIESLNTPPVLESESSYYFDSTEHVGFVVSGQDLDNGDALTYSLEGAPEQLSIDPLTGKISATDLPSGTYQFTIMVTDLSGATASRLTTLTVEKENTPPEFVTQPTTFVDENTTYDYASSAVDPDGDDLTYQNTGFSDQVNVDVATGAFSWQPSPLFPGYLTHDDANCTAASNIDSPFWSALNWKIYYGPGGHLGIQNWDVDDDQVTAIADGNGAPSFYVSDTTLTDAVVEVDIVVNGYDDDIIGFVWGFQDQDHFYRFRWSQNSEVGMQVHKIDSPPGSRYEGSHASDVELFNNSHLFWKRLVNYRFILDVKPGGSSIYVIDDTGSVIESIQVKDYQYLSGKFGFYVHSQDDVHYKVRYLKRQPAADVLVESMNLSELNADEDKIAVTVKNRGAIATDTEIPLTLATGTYDSQNRFIQDSVLQNLTIPAMQPGESVTLETTVSSLAKLDKILSAKVDSSNQINECNEGNNTYYVPLMSLKVSDPSRASDQQHFIVNVRDVAEPPVIHGLENPYAIIGETYESNILATDPDYGDNISYQLVDAPAGMGIYPFSSRLVWTPTDEPAQSYDVTVRATDIEGNSVENTFQVALHYKPEILSTPVYVAYNGEAYSYDVEAVDQDGDTLQYELVEAPDFLSIDPETGLITGTPTVSGTYYPVTIRVSDGREGVTEQQFDLAVLEPGEVNIAPSLANNTPPLTVDMKKDYSYTFTVEDADGLAPKFTLLEGPTGMQLNQDTGELYWAVPITHEKHHNIKIGVYDRRGGFDEYSYVLSISTVSNAAPVVSSTPIVTAVVGKKYTYDIIASDPDGDPLTYYLAGGPAGMVLNDHTIEWTPTAYQVGEQPVYINVADFQDVVFHDFVIAVSNPVSNQPPKITSTPPTSAVPGQQYNYTVEATDPDGDALTYSLSNAPVGMSISPQGLIQWTPGTSDIGTHTIEISVSDAASSDTQQYFLVVNPPENGLPQFTFIPVYSGVVGQTYALQMTASDPDGDPITFGATQAPAGMTVSPGGLISWIPSNTQTGSQQVSFYADDGIGRTFIQYSIDVTSNPLPLDADITVTPDIINPGDTVTISVLSSGGTGTLSTTLRVDSVEVPLSGSGQAQITAANSGTHSIEVTVSDGTNTIVRSAYYSVYDPTDTTLPIATLTTPDQDALITAPTDIIGTVQDDNLAQYRILIAPRGQSDYTEIAKGNTNVTEGVLGQLDPTMLQNGLYTVVLEATDVNGQKATDSRVVTIDGDMKVGNFSLTFEDLKVDLAGIPIRVTRTYDTRRRGESLDFGHGWSIDYQNVQVQESRIPGFSWSLNYYNTGLFGKYCVQPNGNPMVTVRLPNGDLDKFRVRAEPECTDYVANVDVNIVFEPVEGTYSKLEQTDYGLVRLANGNIIDLGNGEPLDPTNYRLTTKDGMVYTLNQNSGVRRVDEPGGQYVTYSDTGIKHSLGYAINFERDAEHRITALVLPDGRRIEYTYTSNGDLASVTDMSGNVTKFDYSVKLPHYLGDIIDPRGIKATRMEYDDDGRLVAVVDAEGNRVEYEHDLAGNTELVRDRNGNQTLYVYDNQGRVLAETNALGETITRTYNTVGDVLTETNDLNETTSWTYDNRGNQLTKTDPLGNTTTYTYTDNGQVLTEVDPLGNTVINNVIDSTTLKLLSVTDGLEHTTSFKWDTGPSSCGTGISLGYTDAVGNSMTVQPLCDGPLGNLPRYQISADGVRTDFGYDSAGHKTAEVTTQTDDQGNSITLITHYAYDDEDRVTAVTHPDGTITQTEYNPIGKVSAEIDAIGRRTEYEYDSRGEQTLVRYPDGSTETKAYDPAGHLIEETDRLGRTTRYTYDAANRQVETILPDDTPDNDADNPVNRNEYDGAGRVTATIDALGNRTEYEYDAAGRRVLVRDALGHETHYEYDAAGHQTAVIDALGHRTEQTFDAADRLTKTHYADTSERLFDYDAMNRKTSATDELGRTTSYAYDASGRLTQVTDSLGKTTRYTYDEQGNKLAQIDAKGHTTHWRYDSMGRVISRTLPLGQTETFTYDELGRQTSHVDFNGRQKVFTYNNNDQLVRIDYQDGTFDTYTYDVTGNRLSATNEQGTDYYYYDALNRLTREEQSNGAVLTYVYDAAGNRTEVTLTYQGNSYTTRYRYDALNRLQQVEDNAGGQTLYTYDAVGNRGSVTYPNGNVGTYAYDTRNRLTALETQNNAQAVLQAYTYTLDATGRRIQIDESSGRHTVYHYDDLYRLTSESVTDAANGNYLAEYQYDNVGNRTQSVIDSQTTQYDYDANDRLLQQGNVIYTYDQNGNTLSENDNGLTKTYTYNDRNKLVGLTQPDTSQIRYYYNANGIRTGKTASGLSTAYVVDQNRDYSQVLLENTGSDEILYTYGDDLLSRSRGSDSAYYHYDGLGSTRGLSDATGSLTDTWDYSAFGGSLNRTGSTENSYLFTGEQFDTSLNQYYLRARYYDQSVGRFTQMDSWSGLDIQPESLNKYLYADSDGVNHVDPSGNFTMSELQVQSQVSGILNTFAIGAIALHQFGGTDSSTGLRCANRVIQSTMGVYTKPASQKDKECDDNLNQMRLQLQQGSVETYGIARMNFPEKGVTVRQMQGALNELFLSKDFNATWFPEALDSWLRSSIVTISMRLNTIPASGGIIATGTVSTLKQETFNRGKEYRLEIENSRGHNLRNFN